MTVTGLRKAGAVKDVAEAGSNPIATQAATGATP